jgi:hypothetical protein
LREILLYIVVALWGVARYYYFKKNDVSEEPVDLSEGTFSEYDPIVSAKIPYYTRLSLAGKQRFISRLTEVLDTIIVRGKEDFEVTRES